MLHKHLSSLLAAKGGQTLGFRLSRELDECGKDIMAVFGVSDFYRDYEDTWEWLEGNGSNGLQVNVSRPHNWKSGEYGIPVTVRVSAPIDRLSSEFLSAMGQRLADCLQTEVWIGNVMADSNSRSGYKFVIEQRFTPLA